MEDAEWAQKNPSIDAIKKCADENQRFRIVKNLIENEKTSVSRNVEYLSLIAPTTEERRTFIEVELLKFLEDALFIKKKTGETLVKQISPFFSEQLSNVGNALQRSKRWAESSLEGAVEALTAYARLFPTQSLTFAEGFLPSQLERTSWSKVEGNIIRKRFFPLLGLELTSSVRAVLQRWLNEYKASGAGTKGTATIGRCGDGESGTFAISAKHRLFEGERVTVLLPRTTPMDPSHTEVSEPTEHPMRVGAPVGCNDLSDAFELEGENEPLIDGQYEIILDRSVDVLIDHHAKYLVDVLEHCTPFKFKGGSLPNLPSFRRHGTLQADEDSGTRAFVNPMMNVVGMHLTRSDKPNESTFVSREDEERITLYNKPAPPSGKRVVRVQEGSTARLVPQAVAFTSPIVSPERGMVTLTYPYVSVEEVTVGNDFTGQRGLVDSFDVDPAEIRRAGESIRSKKRKNGRDGLDARSA